MTRVYPALDALVTRTPPGGESRRNQQNTRVDRLRHLALVESNLTSSRPINTFDSFYVV